MNREEEYSPSIPSIVTSGTCSRGLHQHQKWSTPTSCTIVKEEAIEIRHVFGADTAGSAGFVTASSFSVIDIELKYLTIQTTQYTRFGELTSCRYLNIRRCSHNTTRQMATPTSGRSSPTERRIDVRSTKLAIGAVRRSRIGDDSDCPEDRALMAKVSRSSHA